MRVRVGRNLTSFPLPGKMTKVKLLLSVECVGAFVRSSVSKTGGAGKGLVTCAVCMCVLLKSLTSCRAAQQIRLVFSAFVPLKK